MDYYSYKNLEVWKKARELNKEIYLLTKKLPKEELYALSDQIRRSSVSIAANIAEGNGRDSLKEFINFLSYANGSLCETESHLWLAVDVGYLTEQEIKPTLNLITKVGILIKGLYNSKKEILAAMAAKPPKQS